LFILGFINSFFKTVLMRVITIIFLLFISISSFGQDKPAYVIYNSKGKKVTFAKMVKSLQDQNVILFGEFHDNPISHWLQFELTKDLSESRDLILGAEMFEADNQDELNAY